MATYTISLFGAVKRAVKHAGLMPLESTCCRCDH